ncbi:hypothetical protein BEP19_10195 [Ammoniphilus oxalaticus]|uniref:Phage holin family protein n=1 Tax=Ammoniphilus oxalaticus TaxID=66863 RepID=A0A419SFQ8_9BACL|nr:phage holin family protein [Ammoniphilus oxalaticus]RKD22622.1 hypothetical protein BEP19_10195 [Ammoniphilus oxalaticus]
MKWFVRFLISGVSLWAAAWLLDSIHLSGFGAALVAAFILGLVNMTIKPLLVIFTLPVTILSFGLFLLVINAFTYWFTSLLVPGFEIYSMWGAFWGAIITTIVSSILNGMIKD